MNLTFTVTVNEDTDYIKDEIIQAAANQILNEVMRNQDHYGRSFRDNLTCLLYTSPSPRDCS